MNVIYSNIKCPGTKQQKIGYINLYIIEISDIGQYRYDFTNRKSSDQKIGQNLVKSPIFRRNIESIFHARMC